MELQTERLVIVPPRINDLDDVYQHKTDIDSTLFTGGATKLSQTNFKDAYIETCKKFDVKKDNLYSVILKKSDKYIGYCGFQYCDILENIEILYGYNSKYWGNGYAFEAAYAILAYGFSHLGLEKVVAAVNPQNPSSEKILHKIGLILIGNIKWPNQGIVNKYSLSKEQWK